MVKGEMARQVLPSTLASKKLARYVAEISDMGGDLPPIWDMASPTKWGTVLPEALTCRPYLGTLSATS